MRVVNWPRERARVVDRSVVTLGVFDGVHVGHRALIRQVVAAARQRSCSSVVVTLDRHPAAVLSDQVQPAITSLQHRLRLFRSFRVDLCVVVAFSPEVANMQAEEFARAVFGGLLGAELLVLGFDCRFGRGREGGVELCRRLGGELGWQVDTVTPVEVNGEPVSSTAVRKAVLDGRLELAERLLGRPFSLYGTVVPGSGRGAVIGYPTANLDLHNETLPPDGVYASWAFAGGQPLPAVTSVGRRPTFHHESDAPRVVEVCLLEGGRGLYGHDIEVQFVRFLRGQRRFANAKELQAQIARDIVAARGILIEPPPAPRGQ